MSEPKRTLDWETVWEQIEALLDERLGAEYSPARDAVWEIQADIQDIIEAQLRQQNAA